MPPKLTNDEFIKRSQQLHGHKFDYSHVNYNGLTAPVKIVCQAHGEFMQTPHTHLGGSGCPVCGRIIKNIKIANNKDRSKRISQSKLAASPSKKASIQSKRVSTLQQRYGVDNPAQLPDFKSKLNQAFSKEISTGVTVKDRSILKAKNTLLEKYGVDNIFKRSDLIQDAFFKKHGVYNPAHVADMVDRSINTSYKSKDYEFPSGKKIKVQGYEHIVLGWLIENGVEESSIITERITMPEIWYVCPLGKRRRYYPDIYVPSIKLIVEVKSTYTYAAKKDINNRKKQACTDLGYSFAFIICNKNSIIEVK